MLLVLTFTVLSVGKTICWPKRDTRLSPHLNCPVYLGNDRMSLAKRLEEQVREGRMTEDEADQILSDRVAMWSGQEEDGQMLLLAVHQKE